MGQCDGGGMLVGPASLDVGEGNREGRDSGLQLLKLARRHLHAEDECGESVAVAAGVGL